MSDKLVILIETKINQIFEDYPVNTELTELKKEIISDILASVEEKIRDGVDENQAIDSAISEFGDIDDLIDQVIVSNPKTLNSNDSNLQINSKKTQDDYFKQFDNDFDTESDLHTDVGQSQLVNEQKFQPKEFEKVEIRYNSVTIAVLPTNDDEIILREYMSRDNPNYYANISKVASNLTIKQGNLPHLLPLKVQVQLLIPKSYTDELRIINNSGKVIVSDIPNLEFLKIKVNSGTCQIHHVSAKNSNLSANSGVMKLSSFKSENNLDINIHSGSLKFERLLSKNIQTVIKSGVIKGSEFIGGGQFETTSGSIVLGITDLLEDVRLKAHSGTLKIIPDSDLTYNFDLAAKSGTVKIAKNVQLNHDTQGFKDGKVGENPQYTIRASANSGTINFK